MDCEPVVEVLPFFRQGSLPDEEQRQVQAHLEGCPRCQASLSELESFQASLRSRRPSRTPAWREPVEPSRRFKFAAAAALLLAAGTAWLVLPGSSPEDLRTPRPAQVAAPRGSRLPVGEGVLLAAPGARLTSGAKIFLQEGRFWIHAQAPLALNTLMGRITLEGGQAGLKLGPRPSVAPSLLGAALADETGGVAEWVLLEGCRAQQESGPVWKGPCQVRFDPGVPAVAGPLSEAVLAAAFSWRDEAEGAGPWQDLLGKATQVGPGSSWPEALLQPAGGVEDVVLEAEIRVPAGCQVALCYPVSSTLLGSGALSPGQWQRFRLYKRAGRVEVFLRSRQVVASEASTATAGDPPSVGLRVWQGPAEVRCLRWRALSPWKPQP